MSPREVTVAWKENLVGVGGRWGWGGGEPGREKWSLLIKLCELILYNS